MSRIIVAPLAILFLALSALHFYWLFGGRWGMGAAVPSANNKPAFRPSHAATGLVAIGLALCAVLVAATAGMLTLPVPHFVLLALTRALALVLLIRAIGDFRLIGFFKRVKGSRFAAFDTKYYSPLCLLLSVGVAIIGFTGSS